MSDLRTKLRDDLKKAMRRRDAIEVSALRTVISAIDNAEAVDLEARSEPVLGLSPDVPRRQLTADEIIRIVRDESEHFRSASMEYAGLGRSEEAAVMAEKVLIVSRYLDHHR